MQDADLEETDRQSREQPLQSTLQPPQTRQDYSSRKGGNHNNNGKERTTTDTGDAAVVRSDGATVLVASGRPPSTPGRAGRSCRSAPEGTAATHVDFDPTRSWPCWTTAGRLCGLAPDCPCSCS